MVEQITRDKGRLSNWGVHSLIAIGRLKREASISGARAEAGVLEHRIEMDHPDLKRDRKSTRLNSSHGYISYAVFCLKKKKEKGAKHRHHIDPARVSFTI